VSEPKSTDDAWEEWGQRDPYFGVITNPRFRRGQMDAEAKREFLESGRVHADYVMRMVHTHITPEFRPRTILDFGCGVGRLVIPFAAQAEQVTGADVSPSMLAEAARNCAEHGVANARLVVSDDALTGLPGPFDLVHSFIVFQHIDPARGRDIFRRLLGTLASGGVGALHFVYAKRIYAATYGVAPPPEPPPPPPPPQPPPTRAAIRAASKAQAAMPPAAAAPEPAPNPDPDMQMNSYPAAEMLFLVQEAGVTRFHVEFTDHGGELGLFLFFRKP